MPPINLRNLTDVLTSEDKSTIIDIISEYSRLPVTLLNKLLTQGSIVDGLDSILTTKALSAAQGKILKDLVDLNTAGVAANLADIATISEAIGNLATSQGTIEDSGTPLAITVAEQQIDFVEVVASTNTEVFEFDDVANTITFKKPGSYNFVSSVTLESATNDPVSVTFTLRNTADEAILSEQTVPVEIQNGDKATFPVNTLIIVAEGAEPITMKIMVEADVTGMTLFSFSSLLVSMASPGSITDHNTLSGRSTADAHPQSAITGLVAALAAKAGLTTTNHFTKPQSGAYTAEDNAIDFSQSPNYELTATAANITVGTMGVKKGQEGTLTIHSSENITGWGTEFRFSPDFSAATPTPPELPTGTMKFWYEIIEINGVDGGTSDIIYISWAQ